MSDSIDSKHFKSDKLKPIKIDYLDKSYPTGAISTGKSIELQGTWRNIFDSTLNPTELAKQLAMIVYIRKVWEQIPEDDLLATPADELFVVFLAAQAMVEGTFQWFQKNYTELSPNLTKEEANEELKKKSIPQEKE